MQNKGCNAYNYDADTNSCSAAKVRCRIKDAMYINRKEFCIFKSLKLKKKFLRTNLLELVKVIVSVFNAHLMCFMFIGLFIIMT